MSNQIDIDALERAALAATQGKWSLKDDSYSGEPHYMVVGPNNAPLFDSVNRSPSADPSTEKADLLLASLANPATIIELILRLSDAHHQRDELLSEISEYKKAQKDLHDWRNGYRARIDLALRQRDQLLAAIRGVLDDAEECQDADDWTAMLLSLEAFHNLDTAYNEVIASVEGGAA